MGKMFDDAIQFAVEKHAGQTRKGTEIPYIVHPMEVAAIVAGMTTDEKVLSAAVLHDVLEDTDCSREGIEAAFGEEVTKLVAAESENKRDELPAASTWRTRKGETLEHLKAACVEARMIALGDKLANIRAMARDYAVIGDELWKRFNNNNPADHAWYYSSIAGIFNADPLLKDLPACKEYSELVNSVFGQYMGE